MLSYEQQAVQTLKVYLDRGLEALDAITNKEWDRFNEIFTLRKAAFHNFRAIDANCNLNFSSDIEEIYREIGAVNEQLEAKIGTLSGVLKVQLANLKKHKNTISKFHSGSRLPVRFQNPV